MLKNLVLNQNESIEKATKMNLLIKLEEMIKSNKKLNKLFPNASNLVFGEGNIDSKVFFIGEAPGKKEDLLARPFVGASGRILDKSLSDIKLNRTNVYITNIVKYRPDENRDPSEYEKSMFLPYLISQISIIRPKLIITLGRHSLNTFLPDKKINKTHGKIMQINLNDYKSTLNIKSSSNNYNLLSLFHPAATIYNRNLKHLWDEDFLKILNFI